MTLRTLNYGNYGIFLVMDNAGFCPSTVGLGWIGLKVQGFVRHGAACFCFGVQGGEGS